MEIQPLLQLGMRMSNVPIARGKEVVVVGDSKQLPPTNFFAKLSDESLEDEEDFDELESVLDECAASGLPSMRLLWHYRSRHESLIAFSNYHYYNNRLHTFPSPEAEPERLGVSMRYLPEGVYDRSRSRTNEVEAKAVVAEIVDRLLEPADEVTRSIGVVTFSMAQQVLVEDLLDQARREHPEIEPYFSGDSLEPVFVKNLESVQGDERGTILFSVGYGPDAAGKVSMNFGPLNREGGERRLNVAITRAREEVIVFCSLRADQIDLSRTSRVGVKHLKSFLDYADRGTRAIAESTSLDGSGEFESPFEEQVCEALVARGWTVDTQVGCSGYRIDLGVRDPERLGAYLMGIECDGAFYHSGKTARDRDRLRQGVLESLGWQLHRIWSRDWWLDPEGQLDRIEAALEAAQRDRVTEPAPPAQPAVFASAPTASPAPAEAASDHEPEPEDEPQPLPPGADLCEPYRGMPQRGGSDAFYEPRHESRVVETIEAIVAKEAPISTDLLTRRLMDPWQIGRMTGRVTDRVDELLRSLEAEQRVRLVDGFVWRADQDPEAYSHFRMPADPQVRDREIGDIPSREIANACSAVLRQQISLPIDDLAKEVARLFGVVRVSEGIRSTIEAEIHALAARGGCSLSDGQVALRE